MIHLLEGFFPGPRVNLVRGGATLGQFCRKTFSWGMRDFLKAAVIAASRIIVPSPLLQGVSCREQGPLDGRHSSEPEANAMSDHEISVRTFLDW